MGKKSRKKVMRMFLRGFIQSFFIVSVLFLAGILGYRAATHYWAFPKEEADFKEDSVATPEPVSTATADELSKNLIFCYDEDRKEICNIVLEVFSGKKYELTYMTIPVTTRITMSDTLYQRMVLVDPNIPQIMKFSALTEYLDQDTLFDNGVLLMEDLLDSDISYYTVIPKKIYDTIFAEEMIERSEAQETSEEPIPTELQRRTVPVEIFNEEYMEFLKTLKTEEELSRYIEEIYPSIQSNLSLTDKMSYLDSYSKTPLKNIAFEQIPGDDYNSGFVIDKYQVHKRFQLLEENP